MAGPAAEAVAAARRHRPAVACQGMACAACAGMPDLSIRLARRSPLCLWLHAFLNKNSGLNMTKSELIERIAGQQKQLSPKDVELAVKMIIEYMASSLAQGERIEIRGFGSFSLHYREPRRGRNPKTGDAVDLLGKYVPYFKPGKEMRERVNLNANQAISG